MFGLPPFTLWLIVGTGIALALLIISARRAAITGEPNHDSQRDSRLTVRWLDVALGAALGGAVGARIGHVLLNQPYFSVYLSARPDELWNLSAGGLDWHGAIIGAWIIAALVALIRRVRFGAWLDCAALGLPFIAAGTWIGSLAARATYGAEVRTSADFPAWLVIESANIYGEIAPRLNLLIPGMVLCLLTVLIAFGLTRLRALQTFGGIIFGFTLAVFALGMALIDPFRADQIMLINSRRADHILDLGIAGLAVFLIIGRLVLHLIQRNSQRRQLALNVLNAVNTTNASEVPRIEAP